MSSPIDVAAYNLCFVRHPERHDQGGPGTCDECRASAQWPCANYTEPVTCLTAPSSEAGRCDWCRSNADRDGGHLSVRINADCADHLIAMQIAGMTATEVVRQALALHKFVQDGGRLVAPDAVALIPPVCWVLNSPADGPVCTDMIGGGFPNGAKFTEDMCCLPCRLRLALDGSHSAPSRDKGSGQ